MSKVRAARLDESLFNHLAAADGVALISLFLPTHMRGREVGQDRIRLKNQLSAADEMLGNLGWKPRHRSELLADAENLLDDVDFWEHQLAGLAVYINDEGDVQPVATTRPVSESAIVMPVFMVRPLVTDLDVITVPVLALTRDDVALFTANAFGVEQVATKLPSYGEVNWFVDREKARQQHPDSVGSDRSRHGHDPSTKADEDLSRFLREVASVIEVVEGLDAEMPLIVLGDDDMTARFAGISTRSTLSPPNSGIRAPFTSAGIHEQAAPLLSDLESEHVERTARAAKENLGEGNATIDIREAAPAAREGRVGRVLVHRTADPIWGRLDASTLEVDVHSQRESGDVDLLDRLVVWARDNGAEIVSTESPIENSDLLATFRY